MSIRPCKHHPPRARLARHHALALALFLGPVEGDAADRGFCFFRVFVFGFVGALIAAANRLRGSSLEARREVK